MRDWRWRAKLLLTRTAVAVILGYAMILLIGNKEILKNLLALDLKRAKAG